MILRIFMVLYRLLWALLLPLVLAYLFKRGRKDALYGQNLGERFGFYKFPLPKDALWFHAVSLGETRSATALIRLALARGERIVLTNFTPAGRRESEHQFAAEIATGQLAVVWAPLDIAWCYRRFFRACTPRIALMLEVEIWPAMVFAARRAGVPLYLCNALYGTEPFARDSKGLRLRQRVISNCAGAFVKSEIQAARFAAIGLRNITVTGELRFDQPIPQAQLHAAATLRPQLTNPEREVITLASVVAGEEALYVELIQTLIARAKANRKPAPFFVFVPRAPERFDPVAQRLTEAGLTLLRRSDALSAGVSGLSLPLPPFTQDADVLLGDSLGEMFFYLSLSDRVAVGGGFLTSGAHNIIEPLSVQKPTLTGPHIWTIEFPFVEAQAAHVALSLPTPAKMAEALAAPSTVTKLQISDFIAQHKGASQRTLTAIDQVLHDFRQNP